jgi:hypothetical protein
MINQAIRGSFECYANADKIVSGLDHITEVNEDIMNLNDSINLNLCTLNEEMGFDLKFKEKLSVEGRKLNNGKIVYPKYFITFPDLDRDIVLEENVIQSITNLPDADEFDKVVEPEPELEPKKSVLYVNVDSSISSEVSDGDKEAEVVESNSIYDNDGMLRDQSEYVENVCIPVLPNLRLWLESLQRKAIISADSSSSEE